MQVACQKVESGEETLPSIDYCRLIESSSCMMQSEEMTGTKKKKIDFCQSGMFNLRRA